MRIHSRIVSELDSSPHIFFSFFNLRKSLWPTSADRCSFFLIVDNDCSIALVYLREVPTCLKYWARFLCGISSHGNTSAISKLQAIKDKVNMSLVGIISTTIYDTPNAMALREACIKFGVAQALLDGISIDETGLAVRNIYPSLDLNLKSENDNWKWTYPAGFSKQEKRHRIVNCGYRDSNRDRSVLVFYGLCNLSLLKNKCYATRVEYGRLHKPVEIIPLDEFENGYAFFATPVLYKKNDDIRIDVFYYDYGDERCDYLKLIGLCVEPLGQTIYG